MKKTTRLTALLLALVLLLGNLSASATETNEIIIPLDSLTADVYATLLADAETVGLAAGKPCGSSNPYCASVTKLVGMATAQERYDYLAGLSSVQMIGVLMHYKDYQTEHTAEDILCLCAPNLDAVYAPGDIEKHDAACPWHFANLTVNEQYHILMKLDADAQTEYKATLSEEQQAELEKFSREIEVYYPCDPDTCPIAEKYNKDFFAMDTFYLYEYLEGLKEEDGDPSGDALEIIEHLRNNHTLDDVFCQCAQFTFVNSSHKFGRSHHTGYTIGDLYIDCPWRFDMLTTAEQAQVLAELEKEDADTDYAYALLSDKQKADLDAFLDGVDKMEETITAKDPDSTEETLVTASITVPAGVFGTDAEGDAITHVMEAGEALMTAEKASALNAAFTGHTLAAFDISFYNLNRPGEKLQPVSGQTVPLTFTVDVSKVDGDSMQVYHLIENEDGSITAEAVGEPVPVNQSEGTQTITINADSFSTYTIGALCSGTGDCGYFDFAALSGFARAELLASWVDETAFVDDTVERDQYDVFMGHLSQYHQNATEVCMCLGNKYEIVKYGYGTLKHSLTASDFYGTTVVCPWHFSQVSVEDEYTVYQTLSDTDKTAALDSIKDEAKKAELLAMINAPEITVPEWNGESESIELSFAQTDAAGYVWEKGVENADGTITWTVIEGQTGATLTLDLTTPEALGYMYRCEATLTDNSTVKSAALVLVDGTFRGWILSDAITVTKAMLARALEVQTALDARGADYGALEALRLEGTELYSVYTGTVLADYDAETGAIIDRSMGLIVGYVDTENGTIVAPPADDAAGGDDTTNG